MDVTSAIDIDHLEKYVAGDDALRDEVLSIFAEQAGKLVGMFHIQQPDEGWKDTAHALKGASRGVGAWTLGDLCEEAERLVGAAPAKMENRASLLVSIRETLHQCQAAAEKLRNGVGFNV
jgi:HPt (histidine-containing phosphotransfer) domain-containing protein